MAKAVVGLSHRADPGALLHFRSLGDRPGDGGVGFRIGQALRVVFTWRLLVGFPYSGERSGGGKPDGLSRRIGFHLALGQHGHRELLGFPRTDGADRGLARGVNFLYIRSCLMRPTAIAFPPNVV